VAVVHTQGGGSGTAREACMESSPVVENEIRRFPPFLLVALALGSMAEVSGSEVSG
jgi:hypothetical protein